MNQPLALPDAFNGVELLLRVDEVNLARAGLEALARVAPDAARMHLLRGWITLHERDATFAAKHFRLAIGRDPLEPLAWHGLGSALPAGKGSDRGQRTCQTPQFVRTSCRYASRQTIPGPITAPDDSYQPAAGAGMDAVVDRMSTTAW